MNRYEILQCGDVEKVIRKRNGEFQDIIYFAHIDDMFDIIKRIHVSTGHGGRDKMTKVSEEAKTYYYEGCCCKTYFVKGV